MKTHVLTGSKAEIAEALARIDGEIREVIVVVEEPSDSTVPETVEEMFAEMEPYMVQVGGVDCSREAIYTRMEGE
jgi:dTDP-4-dehydrorhamnose reductase